MFYLKFNQLIIEDFRGVKFIGNIYFKGFCVFKIFLKDYFVKLVIYDKKGLI